jgi:trimethylamine--corrinoid protein Co-methyltransferase
MKRDELQKIHDASMSVLENTGVAFHSDRALEVFRGHGFKTDHHCVFIPEKRIIKALSTAPSSFTVFAKNPAASLTLDKKGRIALAPAYGAPFLIDNEGCRRKTTIRDYEDLCKLIQTSPVLNMNGFLMCDPSDLDPKTRHLDMLLAGIPLCDKPFMGSPLSKTAAEDSANMAKLAAGENGNPMMIANTNSLAPLSYSADIADAMMVIPPSSGAEPPLLPCRLQIAFPITTGPYHPQDRMRIGRHGRCGIGWRPMRNPELTPAWKKL